MQTFGFPNLQFPRLTAFKSCPSSVPLGRDARNSLTGMTARTGSVSRVAAEFGMGSVGRVGSVAPGKTRRGSSA
jgi:hypothetical protein